MKALLFIVLIVSGLSMSGCGQYGGLYLPNTKKTAPVIKKTIENPSSTESVVNSDTPP